MNGETRGTANGELQALEPRARWPRVIGAAIFIAMPLVGAGCTGEASGDGAGPVSKEPAPAARVLPGSLRLVGHDPLFARGMNAALAVVDDYVYVGSRTDGSRSHAHPGVLVVDVSDPSSPRVIHEIGPPDQGDPGETSRELRVWPTKDLLLVMNFGCDWGLHDCARRPTEPSIRFYDIRGAHAARPRLVTTYRPSASPHEFFLWQDPADPSRALVFMSTTDPVDHLLVADISAARDGRVREVGTWGTAFPDPGPFDALHSLSVSPDGRSAYLAYLTAGFFVLDVSELAEGVPRPQMRTITSLEARAQWPGAGPHSAVRIPGRELVLTTDEVYGSAVPQVTGGCPWGWVRLIDITDEGAPSVLAEYRVPPHNVAASCETVDQESDARSSFSSHNPTVTEHLAFVTWHSAGLQVIDTSEPERPAAVAEFLPEPLPMVTTEDPALSSGPDRVVMWSYPVIQDGLIYVVDVRNGLYVLRYRGPLEEEVGSISFLEGNSNLGDASGTGRP